MNRLLAIVSLGLMGAATLFAATPQAPREPAAAPATRPAGNRLVVHEWGTFTGFAGSDGVHLPFVTDVGVGLPPFVSNRHAHAAKTVPQYWEEFGFRKWEGLPALQRMETPVVYFYADRPFDVEARVDFPGGLLSEFYPPVRAMGPAFGKALGEGPIAAGTQPPSFLDWGRVRIVPNPAGDQGTLVPPVTDGNHYRFARETDANLVQFTDTDGKRHEERFLFYRGLGNFKLPVTLAARGGGRFELNNTTAAPISTAFLFRTDGTDQTPACFAQAHNITGRQEMTLPTGEANQQTLSDAIVAALVAEGLYEKEARAMVATWKASWLGEPGTRVLYIVPRTVTDALLPLRIAPTPQETVRVLVGRIDVLTPEQETRLSSMMSAVAAAGPAGLTDADVNELTSLRRFVKPAVERVSGLRGEPTVAQAPAAVTPARQFLNAFAQRRADALPAK